MRKRNRPNPLLGQKLSQGHKLRAKEGRDRVRQEVHEQFMKHCFGDDFWERPVEERFEMAIQRALRVPVTALGEGKPKK